MDRYGRPVFDVLNVEPDLRENFEQNERTWTPELLRGIFSADPAIQARQIVVYGRFVEHKMQELATNEGYQRFNVGDHVITEGLTRVGIIENIHSGIIDVAMQAVNHTAPVLFFPNPINDRLEGEPFWSRYFENGRPLPNGNDMDVSYLFKYDNPNDMYDPTLNVNPVMDML